jgi:glycerophosphoryl diester phosphodiesterase
MGRRQLLIILAVAVTAGSGSAAGDDGRVPPLVQLGPRPFYLVQNMDDSLLRQELESCAENTLEYNTSLFSIGHRGAKLQFPEHTRQSYEAAARMGAGIVECDVIFTKDRELVCRHSSCDLHLTTNVLVTELASKCTQPFVGADESETGRAQAKCCTHDFTLEEIKSLCGKMDGRNDLAQTPEEYLLGTSNFRTDLYSFDCPEIMSHREYIRLDQKLGTKIHSGIKDSGGRNAV